VMPPAATPAAGMSGGAESMQHSAAVRSALLTPCRQPRVRYAQWALPIRASTLYGPTGPAGPVTNHPSRLISKSKITCMGSRRCLKHAYSRNNKVRFWLNSAVYV
jgi:hypothetical protein